MEYQEQDLEGDDPIENDGAGDGIKLGCTSPKNGFMMNGSQEIRGISFASSLIALLVFSMILH